MKIFISHHHDDVRVLAKFKQSLAGLEIECFLAHEDISHGEEFFNKIQEYLTKECAIFLLIGTQKALKSMYVQQEIGMALGANKPIISTIEKGAETRLLGFTENKQAIVFTSIENELLGKFFNEIRQEKYAKFYNERMKKFTTGKAPFFHTNENIFESMDFVSSIKLVEDNWNDFNYYTAFTLHKDSSIIGFAKIAYRGQRESVHTMDKMPDAFFQLPSNFFSIVKFEENMPEDEASYIYKLLNDLEHCPEIARKHYQEDIVQTSLLRDQYERYQNLKNRIEKNGDDTP